MNKTEWREQMDAMWSDKPFMAWLEDYMPEYGCEYSGTLLGLREAFNAGRESMTPNAA